MAACRICGKEFKQRPERLNPFCSRPCYWASMRGKIKTERVEGRATRAPGHPLAPPSGFITFARLTLYEKIGPGTHPCHWCGNPLEWMPGSGPKPGAIMADHLNWDRTDDSPENLVPSCMECNAHRTKSGRRNLIRHDEPVITMTNGSRTRAVERTCEQCGTKFMAIPAFVRTGRARFCSRSCARQQPRKK